MRCYVDEFDPSPLLMALIGGRAFQFVSQLPQVDVWLCYDVQCIRILDCVDAEGQCFFLSIFGDDLCGFGVPVVVLYELYYIIHIQVAWQFMLHFA